MKDVSTATVCINLVVLLHSVSHHKNTAHAKGDR